MEGVTILTEKAIYNTILPGWWAGVGLVMMLICIPILCHYIAEYLDIAATITSMFIVIGILLMVFGLTSNKNSINYIRYKITVDDSVSVNEFMDKYKILDTEGKIYIVKEK